MGNKRSIAAFSALLVILLGCFFMPNYVAGISDRNTLGTPTLLGVKSISYEASPNLSMPERLTLISSSGHESIMLKNGKALTEHEARIRVLGELERFFGAPGAGSLELAIEDCAAVFVIDSEDPSKNMIVWDFHLSGEDRTIWNVKLDEETGVILHIYSRAAESAVIKPPNNGEDPLAADAERLCGLIEAYYGAPAVPQYELSGGLGYYNAQLDFDGNEVVLYGIVRETGFTVNE